MGFVGQFDFQKHFLSAHPESESWIENYNHTVNLRIEGGSVKSETQPYWTYLGRLMVISLFNILEFSSYNNALNPESIYKFAKHLRNGAAHNNRFHIAPPLQRPILWRNKTINNSLNGAQVFTDFVDPGLLMLLMSDISKLIGEIEKKQRK